VGLLLLLLPTPATQSIGWSLAALGAKMAAVVFCVAVSFRPISMAKAHRRVIDKCTGALAFVWAIKDEALAFKKAHPYTPDPYPRDPKDLS